MRRKIHIGVESEAGGFLRGHDTDAAEASHPTGFSIVGSEAVAFFAMNGGEPLVRSICVNFDGIFLAGKSDAAFLHAGGDFFERVGSADSGEILFQKSVRLRIRRLVDGLA